MTIDWARFGREPQTYILLVGTALGYAVLLTLVGPRPLAWVSGGGIAAAMIGSWAAGFREQSLTQAEADDLLNAIAFQQQIQASESKVPALSNSTWQRARTWATESHQFAANIYQRDPLLQVELLEALLTVVDLTRQVAEALQVIDQIQTPAYRQMAQQRLQASCDRIQETHAQLQQLQDQIALSSLDPGDPETQLLPERLQTLVAANKQILESPTENG
ncbi:MAG TPA: hypothetical protein V6D29_22405 [Leptolyngbyaceae cyanobacterium]